MLANRFDHYGWYTNDDRFAARVAPVPLGEEPPAPVEGQLYPNWSGSQWLMLPYVQPPAELDPQPVEDPRLWWVDVGPFYDRFGVDALAIAASDHGACKAVQTLTGVRKYIDLRDPRVANMIDMLIATAQPAAQPWAPGSGPMTADKKAAILTTPTTEYERHIKGLEG